MKTCNKSVARKAFANWNQWERRWLEMLLNIKEEREDDDEEK